jgi:ribonuclease HII
MASPPSPPSRWALGVDENGLGPRLGPLVVTSILASVTDAGRKTANQKARGKMRERLDDSKKLVQFGASGLGEAWARAIAKRAGASPKTPDELVRAIALDADEVLRAPCPRDHASQCWNAEGEAFTATDDLVADVERDLAKLESKGVSVVRTRVAVVCTKRLNDACDEGRSRFDVDLETMERLVLAARADAGADLDATCGKVGGFDRYALSKFALFAPVRESRARSEYTIPNVGTIAFVRDADEDSLVVAMASLVGKWVRDALMARIIRYHQVLTPDAPDASGYHDPVTTRFIAATRLARKRTKLDDACFERNKLGELTSSARRATP